MREALDQWLFVQAAYGVVIIGIVLLVGLSWRAMRRAEARRDAVKRG